MHLASFANQVVCDLAVPIVIKDPIVAFLGALVVVAIRVSTRAEQPVHVGFTQMRRIGKADKP